MFNLKVENFEKLLDEKKSKIVVWFFGSFGTGKSTQSRLLINFFVDDYINKINYKNILIKKGFNIKVTSFNKYICGIGNFNTNLSSGTDNIGSRLNLKYSIKYAFQKHNIVIIDNAIASQNYFDDIRFTKNVKVLLFGFKYKSIEQAYDRIKIRRAEKEGILHPSKIDLNLSNDINKNNYVKLFTNFQSKFKHITNRFQKNEGMFFVINCDNEKYKINDFVLRKLFILLKGDFE